MVLIQGVNKKKKRQKDQIVWNITFKFKETIYEETSCVEFGAKEESGHNFKTIFNLSLTFLNFYDKKLTKTLPKKFQGKELMQKWQFFRDMEKNTWKKQKELKLLKQYMSLTKILIN